jgi:hypothetical protein
MGRIKTILFAVGVILCLVSLFLPWWTMSTSLSAGSENGYALGFRTEASGNLVWMTITSYGQMPNLNNLPVKLNYTFYGEEYWFGIVAFLLIAVGSLMSIGEILKTRFIRLMPLTLLLLICGIAIYPIGLQMSISLNANQQTNNDANLNGNDFALLDAYSGNFGNTHFGLFSRGVATQQVPAFREIFFPNVPLSFMSYLCYGFFVALTGVILLAIGYKTKTRESCID